RRRRWRRHRRGDPDNSTELTRARAPRFDSPGRATFTVGMRTLQAVLSSLVVATAMPTTYAVRLDTAAAPNLAGRHVATLPQAARLFAKPDRVVRAAGARPVCRAVWERYGLEIRFLTADAGTCAAGDLRTWWQVTLR